jgi:hypothetical protein
VTFGISASNELTPGSNLSGWKVTWLSTTYRKVAGAAGLVRRGDFRVCVVFRFSGEFVLIDEFVE